MSVTYKPENEMVITNLETLKVLSDPFRVRILEQMAPKPITVKQIAKTLGIVPNKLYYHIKMMEEHGLIAVVDEKIVSGIIEKWYQVAANHYRLDKALFSLSSEDKGEHLGGLVDNLMEATRQDIQQGIRSNLIHYDDLEDDRHRMVMTRVAGCMTKARHAEFREKLLSLIDEFIGDEENGCASDGEDAENYVLTMFFFPYEIGPGSIEDESED